MNFLRLKNYLLSLCALCALLSLSAAADDPDLTLANVYRDGVVLSDYYTSEKMDGVRAYWDGKQLRSRRGNVFAAPDWFLDGLPDTPLDGELWSGRGEFDMISGIVRRQKPHDGWRKITYMIFDMPQAKGDFRARLSQMKQTLAAVNVSHVRLVAQWEINDEQALYQKMNEIAAAGGEGLMLRRKESPYRGGRSNDLLKLKPFMDAEARVISHYPGKGKFTGMLGGLVVENFDGVRFKIGTGFTNAERLSPPPPGTIITYKYNGFTKNGKPRFAVFLRVRNEEPLNTEAQ